MARVGRAATSRPFPAAAPMLRLPPPVAHLRPKGFFVATTHGASGNTSVATRLQILAGMPSNNGSKIKALLLEVLEDPAVRGDSLLMVSRRDRSTDGFPTPQAIWLSTRRSRARLAPVHRPAEDALGTTSATLSAHAWRL